MFEFELRLVWSRNPGLSPGSKQSRDKDQNPSRAWVRVWVQVDTGVKSESKMVSWNINDLESLGWWLNLHVLDHVAPALPKDLGWAHHCRWPGCQTWNMSTTINLKAPNTNLSLNANFMIVINSWLIIVIPLPRASTLEDYSKQKSFVTWLIITCLLLKLYKVRKTIRLLSKI